MRVVVALFNLCVSRWKNLAAWALLGPLYFLLFGTGSTAGLATNWFAVITIGSVFGLFVGIMVQINKTCGRARKSATSHVVSEREWTIVTAGLGILCGLIIAHCLELPVYGYAICAALFLGLGMARQVILEILP